MAKDSTSAHMEYQKRAYDVYQMSMFKGNLELLKKYAAEMGETVNGS